ncbi:MAG: type II toxin-antitoxin system RelE/ParE family toxin [bacterium]|nr:type II toxin-antitoxin system RelE/ParE family toxin [bacterium]
MKYDLFLLPRAERDCDNLPKEIYRRCRTKILQLANDPRPSGCKKLVGEDGFRIRSGDYRILYRVDDPNKKVFIYRLKHRKEVYR